MMDVTFDIYRFAFHPILLFRKRGRFEFFLRGTQNRRKFTLVWV
jgi:hypothetical protein